MECKFAISEKGGQAGALAERSSPLRTLRKSLTAPARLRAFHHLRIQRCWLQQNLGVAEAGNQKLAASVYCAPAARCPTNSSITALRIRSGGNNPCARMKS